MSDFRENIISMELESSVESELQNTDILKPFFEETVSKELGLHKALLHGFRSGYNEKGNNE